jgi:hypothetical protein
MSTASHSISNTPRTYEPYSYHNPGRAIAFDWSLEPVEAGTVPIVTLEVSHDSRSKQFRASIYTSLSQPSGRTVSYGMGSTDKWATRRKTVAVLPVARFNKKRLTEFAQVALSSVQQLPDDYNQFFQTDDSALLTY